MKLKKLVLFTLVSVLACIISIQNVDGAGSTYNRVAAISWASRVLHQTPSGPALGGNANNSISYGVGSGRDIGRHCATYLARMMNAGGIPISTAIVGNDQIFEYLSGNRHRYGLGYPSLNQLAAFIRQNSWVAGVDINSYNPVTLRPGDIVFFDVKLISNSIGLNWRWGAEHSAIVTSSNQSPVRLGYWNRERYGVPFNDVLNNAAFRNRNYIVVRFR